MMWPYITILGVFVGLPTIFMIGIIIEHAINSWREVQLEKYLVNKENKQ